MLLSQRKEWGFHKFECAILVRLSKEQQRSPTSTLRLVLRLLIKRRLQAEKVCVVITLHINFRIIQTRHCLLLLAYDSECVISVMNVERHGLHVFCTLSIYQWFHYLNCVSI